MSALEQATLQAVRAFAQATREYNAVIDTFGWSTDDLAYRDAAQAMEQTEQSVLDFGDALLDEDVLLHGDPDAIPNQIGLMYAKKPPR